MGNKKSLTKISKYMSLVLRHRPEVIGISLDEHGWADVKELIRGMKEKYPFDMDTLEEIVRTDEKQRYAFNENRTKIRANQGHSVKVDVELEKKDPPEILYHGTGRKSVGSIMGKGLLPGNRLYVHLSKDTETALKVGKRHGEPVIFSVKSGQMAREGYSFYLSLNGVWLTEAVPARYLDFVYDMPGKNEEPI